MSIDETELQNITVASLNLGNGSNGNVFVDGISAANSNNISSTLTISSANGISFDTGDSTFNVLSLSAKEDIAVNTNLTVDAGNFNATADSDSSGFGSFTLASGKTLSATASSGNVSVTARDIINNGTISAGTSGKVSLNDLNAPTPETTTDTTDTPANPIVISETDLPPGEPTDTEIQNAFGDPNLTEEEIEEIRKRENQGTQSTFVKEIADLTNGNGC
jgi:hypothetical protein